MVIDNFNVVGICAFPNKTNAALSALSIAHMAWKSAVESVRSCKGAKEIKRFRLQDVTVISADQDRAGIVHLTLRSPAPEKAEAGLAANESAISQALRAFYGRTVKLRVIGHEPASASPG